MLGCLTVLIPSLHAFLLGRCRRAESTNRASNDYSLVTLRKCGISQEIHTLSNLAPDGATTSPVARLRSSYTDTDKPRRISEASMRVICGPANTHIEFECAESGI